MLAAHVSSPAPAANGTPSDLELHLPGSLSGSVFVTTHVEDLRRAGIPGISGVRIELLGAAGEVLAEALTNEAGDYEFPALAPGVYAVRQIQPAGLLEGFELVGTGGGALLTGKVIGEIVVQAGAMLRGYDFAELAPPAPVAGELEGAASLVGFLPPLAVSWSRPVQHMAPPSVEPIAQRPVLAAPQATQPIEPIFGGSSGVLDERDTKGETWSVEGEADDEIAQGNERVRVPVESVDMPATSHRRRLAARDEAFEAGEILVQDDVAEARPADDVKASPREPIIARRPPAGDAVKKPAA